MSVMVYEVEEELKVRSLLSSFISFLKLWFIVHSLPTWETRKEIIFSRSQLWEEHRRKWLEWMFGHPTNSASKWKCSKFIICGSPHTAAYGYLSFLLKDLLPVIRQVCLHYWTWKYQISTVPGFLAAKMWKYPREREKLNLYPALLEASISALPLTKTVQLHGSVYMSTFFP